MNEEEKWPLRGRNEKKNEGDEGACIREREGVTRRERRWMKSNGN